jgi:VanZ family protein
MFWKYNYPGISWALLILMLSGFPGEQFERSKIDNADIFVHTFLYAVLFFLLSVGFLKQTTFKSIKIYTLRKTFFISLVFGALIEVLQATVFINRSFQLSDIVFNTVGALLGFACFGGIYGIRKYI